MDFSFTEEQLAFKESVIKFARNELNDDLLRRDHEGELADLQHQCADVELPDSFA
jgi:hypothetical protein